MNNDLSAQLNKLIIDDKIDEAIKLAETELLKSPPSEFNQIIGKDLLHMANDLCDFIESFYTKADSQIGNIKAFYSEMNGFTINYDL